MADAALKLAQRLTEECTMVKNELRDKEKALDKTQTDLESVRFSLTNALQKINELERELDKERDLNTKMNEKNNEMALRILELTAELNKIKGVKK